MESVKLRIPTALAAVVALAALICSGHLNGQTCIDCAEGCAMESSALFYDWGSYVCNCRSSAGCVAGQICTNCVYDGMVSCCDCWNGCGSYYQSTFLSFCGCKEGDPI